MVLLLIMMFVFPSCASFPTERTNTVVITKEYPYDLMAVWESSKEIAISEMESITALWFKRERGTIAGKKEGTEVWLFVEGRGVSPSVTVTIRSKKEDRRIADDIHKKISEKLKGGETIEKISYSSIARFTQ